MHVQPPESTGSFGFWFDSSPTGRSLSDDVQVPLRSHRQEFVDPILAAEFETGSRECRGCRRPQPQICCRLASAERVRNADSSVDAFWKGVASDVRASLRLMLQRSSLYVTLASMPFGAHRSAAAMAEARYCERFSRSRRAGRTRSVFAAEDAVRVATSDFALDVTARTLVRLILRAPSVVPALRSREIEAEAAVILRLSARRRSAGAPTRLCK